MEQMPNSVGIALDQSSGVALSVMVMNGGQKTSANSLSVTPASDSVQNIAVANSTKATYTYSATALALTGTPATLFAIESGPLKTTRLRNLIIWNPGSQTSAGFVTFNLTLTTTAGSTNAVVPVPMDPNDIAYTGTVRSAAATIGTLGTVVYQFSLWVPGAAAAATPFIVPFNDATNQCKTLTLPKGIANGIVCQVTTGNAGATSLFCTVEFTEE